MNKKYDDYKIGDIIKGLKLVSEPYKVDGKKDYMGMVKCILCNNEPYEITLSEIKRHTYDGCRECAKRGRFKKHDNFVQQMKEINPSIIIIGKYVSSKVKIECVCAVCGYCFSALPGNLLRGHGCKECSRNLISLSRRREHNAFIKTIKDIHPNIEVLGEYIRSSETIMCRCLVDGYEWNAWPDHLLRGHGCPVCGKGKLFAGYNDIATVRPDLIKYFKSKKEATMFTEHSSRYADLICPCCGHKKRMLVSHLSKTGFACPVCGDGVSYPNKFCRQVLKQLPVVNLKFEYNSRWTKSYFYDNYFEYNGIKYIVEVDGIQHFQTTSNMFLPVEDIQQIDNLKTQLAIDNGCVVIRIDCRKSEMKYIKNSILDSKLSNIFDLSNINWLMCEQNARTSLLKQVCDFYNASDNKQLKYVAEYFDLSAATTRTYLQRGTNLGMCNYKKISTTGLSVIAHDIDNNKTFTFNSASMCARELSNLYNIKIDSKGVLRICREEYESYKGFTFKFKDGDIHEQSA